MSLSLLQTGVRVKIVQIGAILLLPSNHFGARDCRSRRQRRAFARLNHSVGVSVASKQASVCVVVVVGVASKSMRSKAIDSKQLGCCAHHGTSMMGTALSPAS
jgi:hypothetical protein